MMDHRSFDYNSNPPRQGYDYERDEVLEDLTTSVGFVNALKLALRLQRRGLLFLGLPCNSHTFMSSSQHKRGPDRPYGDEQYGFVIKGNCIAYRSALLIVLVICRSCLWFLENPGNSKCGYLPVLDYLLSCKKLLGSSRTGWSGP